MLAHPIYTLTINVYKLATHLSRSLNLIVV